jgi:hypothetical protein
MSDHGVGRLARDLAHLQREHVWVRAADQVSYSSVELTEPARLGLVGWRGIALLEDELIVFNQSEAGKVAAVAYANVSAERFHATIVGHT